MVRRFRFRLLFMLVRWRRVGCVWLRVLFDASYSVDAIMSRAGGFVFDAAIVELVYVSTEVACLVDDDVIDASASGGGSNAAARDDLPEGWAASACICGTLL